MCRFDDRRQTNLSLISHESYAARALQKRVSTFAKLDDEGDLAMPSRLADTSERFTTANAETSMVKYFPEDADEIDHATPCPETVAQKLSCATLGVQIVQDDAPISSGERPTPLVDHDSSIATSDRFPESPKPADAYRDDSRERQATTDVAELSDSEVSFQGDVQEILFELPKIVDAFCTSTLPSTRDDLCLVAAPVLQQPSDDDGSRLVPKMSHDADAQTSFDFATSENELDNTEEGAALWKSELSVLDANFFDTGTDIAQSSQKAELTPDLAKPTSPLSTDSLATSNTWLEAPGARTPSDDDSSRLVPKMSYDADAQTSLDVATSANELDKTEEGAAPWKPESLLLDANFFDTGTDIAQSSQKAELTSDLAKPTSPLSTDSLATFNTWLEAPGARTPSDLSVSVHTLERASNASTLDASDLASLNESLDSCERVRATPESETRQSCIDGSVSLTQTQGSNDRNSSSTALRTFTSSQSDEIDGTDASEGMPAYLFESVVDNTVESPAEANVATNSTLVVNDLQYITTEQAELDLEKNGDTESEDAWTVASDHNDSCVSESDELVTPQGSEIATSDVLTVDDTPVDNIENVRVAIAIGSTGGPRTTSVAHSEVSDAYKVDAVQPYSHHIEPSTPRASSDRPIVSDAPVNDAGPFETVEETERENLDDAWDEFLQSASSIQNQKSFFEMTDAKQILQALDSKS
ncbi:hypothetical protein CYMTET_44616 [Cymbomonas tetramitiformis]|uniref:Uncharacterized protein n=1 Tax=Cymbomonas tetramitiformis TaxID=36881 RepID=A0AAE0C1H3_9CHLO|nr:hypothetical protein CYMTET_44616 [Cymbomonas tetramitiformis]